MKHKHVEYMKGGMASCYHCGGEVDHDGYAKHMAMGGEVPAAVGDNHESRERSGVGDATTEMTGEDKHLGQDDSEGFELEERQGNEQMSTEQDDSTEDMRQDGFADAIKNRRAMKYAEGGYVAPGERMPSEMKPEDIMGSVKSDAQKNYADEMKKKKQEKYGFGGRR